jgi:SHS2 domain-containing protein
MNYELLEHPADMGFRTRGASLPELFANCGQALVSIILDAPEIQPLQSYKIDAEGADYESLLVNWLNEVLYFVDGKRVAVARFDIKELNQTRIVCTAYGEPRERHASRLVVKAVTYHQLKVAQDADGWVAEVYVDI